MHQVDGVYTKLDKVPVVAVHPGVGSFRLRAVSGPSPSFAVEAGWPGELYRAAAAVPMYAGAPHGRLVINGLDIKLRYVFVTAHERRRATTVDDG